MGNRAGGLFKVRCAWGCPTWGECDKTVNKYVLYSDRV